MSILTPRKPDKGLPDKEPTNKESANKELSKLKRIILVCACIALGLAAVGLVAGVALSAGGISQGDPNGNLNKGKMTHVHKGKKAHVHKHQRGAHKHHKGHRNKGGGQVSPPVSLPVFPPVSLPVFPPVSLPVFPPANAVPTINSVTNNGPVDEGSSVTITVGATDPEGTTLSYEFDCDNDGTYETGSQSANTADCTFPNDGTKRVNVRVTDANGGKSTGSTDITVNNVAPTASAQSMVTDEDASKTITLVGSDPGSDTLTFKVVSLPANGTLYDGANTSGHKIDSSELPYTLGGSGNQVTYKPNTDYNGSDSFDFKANDGTDDSAAAAVSLTVNPVNDAPVVTTSSGSLPYTENDAATAVDSGLTVSDVESLNLTGATVAITTNFDSSQDELAFTNTPNITGSYNNSTGTLTLSGTDTVANYQAALRSVTYANSSDNPSTSTRTVTFTADDGSASNNTGSATRDIAVTAVNDAPVVTTTASSLSFTEGDAATAVDSGLTVSDADSPSLTGATVAITTNFDSSEDTLAFTNTSSITGTWSAATGTLTLSGTDTVANYQAALRSVTYANSSDNPSTSTRTVTFTADEGSASNNTGSSTRNISITAVNDAPVVTTSGGTLAYSSDQSPTAIDPTLTVADIDSSNLTGATVQITNGYVNGKDVLSLANTPEITATFDAATGTLTLTGTSSRANYETALQSVKFQGDNAPGTLTASRTISFQVDDGQSENHSSNVATKSIDVTHVNRAPVAANDAFTANNQETVGNTLLAVGTSASGPHVEITGNVLDNDTDGDTDHSALTASFDSGTNTKPSGSKVTVNSNGSFTFVPPPGATGNQSFTYTVSDNDATDPKSGTGTITVKVANPAVWYVDNSLGSNGDGTSDSPFNQIAPLTTGGSADATDDPGDVIFLYQGSGSDYTGGLALENNQQLIGQPQGLTVTDENAQTRNLVAPSGGPNPTITNTTVSGNGITLGLNNTIRSVNMGNASGSAISGSSFGTLDVAGVAIGSNGQALSLTNGTLTGNGFTGVSSSGGTNNVSLSSVGTSGPPFSLGSGALSGAPADAFKVSGGSGSFTYSGSVSQSSNAPLVSVSGGHNGTLNFNGPLNATNGTGLQFDNADGTYNFNAPAILSNSVSGGNAGIDILDGSGGTFNFNPGSSINNPTNEAITVSSSSPNFTYGGTINKTNGGTGISVASNTGGTITFSGATKTINSGTSTAVNLSNNTNATINFTNGSLDIDTTSGTGFNATGGGTVSVGTGANPNTIDSTTGTALNVANTTIGSSGLTFKSITAGTGSGSAGNGIFLSNTGSSGGLTVAGAGTAGSGGTIQHKTGTDGTTNGIGIYLNNTSSVSLARMQLNDFDNFAIRGTNVNGFSLTNSTINGSNGTSTAADEASLAFDNLTGSASLASDTITGGVEDDARIQNSTGSLSSLSITGSTFATTGANTANDGLSLIGDIGATVFNATVTDNSFTRAQGDLFQYTLKTGTGTLNFSSNTVTNNFPTTLPAGGGDINVSAGSLGANPSLQYTISNNQIYASGTGGQPPNGSVIVAAATPAGSATGTISNNTIGTTGVTQSGGFDAILADAVKAGSHKVTITDNTIRRYKEAGIRLLGVSPAAAPGFNVQATVKGNTITEPDSIAFAGIDAEVGADPSDIGTMCLDLGGSTAADKNSVSNGDPTNTNDINLIQQFQTSMNLPGYSGNATDDNAVKTFVAGRNDGDGTPTVSAIHDTTTGDGNPAGSGFTGSGTNCS